MPEFFRGGFVGVEGMDGEGRTVHMCTGTIILLRILASNTQTDL